jgi:type I restriction enzyme S subunit
MVDNWKRVKLGDYFKLKGGYAFKSTDFIEHGDVPVLRISNINPNGTISLEEAAYVNRELAENNKSFLLSPGNIVIAMSGATTGKTAVIKGADVPSLLNQRVGMFEIKDYNLLSQMYLSYIVQSEEFKNSIGINAIGGAQPNISGKQIEKIDYAIPPISEQSKIANILTSVDNTITKTEAIIEQTEKLKKGLMQELLTKGIGHTKFKQTEIGEIPEEWDVKPLGQLVEFQNGKGHEKMIDENGKYIVINSKFISSDCKEFKRSNLA